MASFYFFQQTYFFQHPIFRTLSDPRGPLPPLVNFAAEEPIAIFVVINRHHLPREFLKPSAENPIIIGFDCEGINLSRHGTLCIMQLCFERSIYLVDAIQGGQELMQACKPGLESSYVTKIIHDCKRDSEALYYQFGIKLHNVWDTQIAYGMIEKQEGERKGIREPTKYISFVNLLKEYCDINYHEKEEVRKCLKRDFMYWCRPWTYEMIRAAADDVRYLHGLYEKLKPRLNQRFLWRLSVRGALYCRCYCITNNAHAHFKPLPPIPDNLKASENPPEEEKLVVAFLSPGQTGLIIGAHGYYITSMKQKCDAEIIMGGNNGPPDTVFLMGPVREVDKAEAMIRERQMNFNLFQRS